MNSLTPSTRYLIGIAVWSTRLLGLAVMIVATGEAVQAGLCWVEERRK